MSAVWKHNGSHLVPTAGHRKEKRHSHHAASHTQSVRRSQQRKSHLRVMVRRCKMVKLFPRNTFAIIFLSRFKYFWPSSSAGVPLSHVLFLRKCQHIFATHPTIKVHQFNTLVVSSSVLQKMRLQPHVIFTLHHTFWLLLTAPKCRTVYTSFASSLLFTQLLLHTIYLETVWVNSRIRLWGLKTRRCRDWLRLQRWQMQVSHHCSQTLPFFAELLEVMRGEGRHQRGHTLNTALLKWSAVTQTHFAKYISICSVKHQEEGSVERTEWIITMSKTVFRWRNFGETLCLTHNAQDSELTSKQQFQLLLSDIFAGLVPTWSSSCWTTCIWTLHCAVLLSSRVCSLLICLKHTQEH